MEQFVLGFFQEHLGKFIVGFRKEMVNANLLNGKGEMKDISINCSAINQQLSNITPFIELESIHISKLGFQVTSWTNLRKAPIVVDIEHITVHISEPLHYLAPKRRKRIRQMTVAEMEQHFRQLEAEAKKNKTTFSNPNKRGAYNLIDRIADNLAIEIKSVYIQFETFGKFKTRRPGPWTPPTVQIILRNLRFVSVDEYGQEGTPEEVWNHNHQPTPRGQERTLLIFKKVTMDYDFGIQTADGKQFSLLKGGGGVPPKPPGMSSQNLSFEPKKPASPTAAETVAALAAATGPVVVPAPAPTAAETVAALAAATGPAPVAPKSSNETQSVTSKPTEETKTSTAPPANSSADTAAGAASSHSNDNTRQGTTGNVPQQDESQSKTQAPNTQPPDDHNNRVVVHIAMKRRIRDGALLALQVDSVLSKVEVLITSEVVPHLVHAATGLEYCFCKDRGFEDPLRHPNDRTDHNDSRRDFGPIVESLGLNGKESNEKEVGENENKKKFDSGEDVTESVSDAGKIESSGESITGGSSDVKTPLATTEPEASSNSNENINTTAIDVANDPTHDTLHAGVSQEATNTVNGGDHDVIEQKTEFRVQSDHVDDEREAAPIFAGGDKDVFGDVDNSSIAPDIPSAIDETIADDNTDIDTLDGTSTTSQPQKTVGGFAKSFSSFFTKQSAEISGEKPTAPLGNSTPASVTNESWKGRAVLMLPNGLVVHEKISISVSVERAIIRGAYPSFQKQSCDGRSKHRGEDQSQRDQDGFIQLDSKGTVVELIWPKANMEKGGYAQASVSYLSIQERCGQRVRTIVACGHQHDVSTHRPVEEAGNPPSEIKGEDSFPVYQDRAIRDDSLGVRHTFPSQAIGLVATIDCQTRRQASPKTQMAAALPTTITTVDGSAKMSAVSERTISIYDQSERTSAIDQSEEEVVNVIKVTNDVGVNKVNVVLDCDSWCRVLRFALNESGGGFDSRWYSGDWVECLSTEMLVHPNATLELENHTQPRAEIFLDENHFVSSDLFNMNALISNCELRLPAAIQENIRSCDIIFNVNELYLSISSELPRTCLSGNVGARGPAETNGEICFPNDPSDIACELEIPENNGDHASFVPPEENSKHKVVENGESIPPEEKSRLQPMKSKSSCRLRLNLQGLSTRIMPVIPFYTAMEPQLLCAPTEMKMLLCFEGEPPETEDSSLIKMSLSLSIAIHSIQMNCDLDLIAGAVSTCLHHFQVVNETLECATQLVPLVDPPSHPMVDEASLSNSENLDDLSSADGVLKIKRTLQGRRVLVHRQFHRSRETGGLRLALGIEVSEYSFTLWRQNVSVHSPYRRSESSADIVDRQKLHFPLLRLLCLTTSEMQIGLEVGFREDDRRSVIKCSVREARLRVCDLSRQETPQTDATRATADHCGRSGLSTDKLPVGVQGVSHGASEPVRTESKAVDSSSVIGEAGNETGVASKPDLTMVEIFHFGQVVPLGNAFSGNDDAAKPCVREEAIVIRCEERFGHWRSRTFAGNIATGGVLNLHIDEMESLFLLILEALMMPTWSRSKLMPHTGGRNFPESSVGALLLSFIPGSGSPFRGFLFLLRKAMQIAFPEDIRMFLFRLRLGTIRISVPEPRRKANLVSSPTFAVMLRRSDLLAHYFSPEKEYHNELLSVLANEDADWSSLIENKTEGISHCISSYQSVFMAENVENEILQPTLTELVPDFEVRLDYLGNKIMTSVENTLSRIDMERFQECLHLLKRFAKRGASIYFHLRSKLAALRKWNNANVVEKDIGTSIYASPVGGACWDVERAISSIRDVLVRICKSLEDHERGQHVLVKSKDSKVEHLQRLVFSKEKERVAAISLVSSHVVGWLRMGGTHQSGQRIATTSTLWAYWAVLRKQMLVLYKGPGYHKPVDFVFLRGARLRVLAGGNSKRDLKRAFGIVEATGRTRFFTVGSDHDFLAWTREIQRASSGNYPMEEANIGVEADKSSQRKVPLDRDDESLGVISAGGMSDVLSPSQHGNESTSSGRGLQFRGKLAGLGTVLRMSKQSSTAEEAKPESKEGQLTQETSSDTVIFNSGEASLTARIDQNALAQPTKVEEKDEDNRSNDSSQIKALSESERGGGSTNRRVQMRGKFGGVGQATSKLGSAFMAARQKGREAAERTRRLSSASPAKGEVLNAPSDNPLHVISEKEDEKVPVDETGTRPGKATGKVLTATWTCPKCTFENTLQSLESDIGICEMCESRSEMANVAINRSAGAAEQGTIQEENERIQRSQSSDSLEIRERVNSGDSGKQLFGRSQSDIASEGDSISIISEDESDVERLGGRGTVRNRLGAALGGIRRQTPDKQLYSTEPERKSWLARLGSNTANQENTDVFQKPQMPLKLKNVRVDSTSDFASMTDPPISNIPLSKLEGHWFAIVTPFSTFTESQQSVKDETVQSASLGGQREESETKDDERNSLQDHIESEAISEQSLPSTASDVSNVRRILQSGMNTTVQTPRMEGSFYIQLFHRISGDSTEQPKKIVYRGISEILGLHALLSECITEIMFHPVFQQRSFHRTTSGEMSEGLKNVLGISPLDSLRVSASLLAGALDAATEFGDAVTPSYNAEAIMEFLNSSLECPFPSNALFALKDFLNIQDAPTVEVRGPDDDHREERPPIGHVEFDSENLPKEMSSRESLSSEILALSSICTAELMQAERSGKLAAELAKTMSPIGGKDVDAVPTSFYEPLLPSHVTEHLQESMHSALMKVMAERDEAHAQLVSASVLHAHTSEQQKKRIERLNEQLELAHSKAPQKLAPVFSKKRAQQEIEEAEKLRKKEMERMQQNSDAELIAICQQLSAEISSRTQAELEVIRQKESRAIERQHEIEEKDALKNELLRVKEQLALEQRKSDEARREADKWRESYAKVAEEHKLRHDA